MKREENVKFWHCVIGLLTSIVWTLIDRLDDVYITDIVYLLDVLVVIVYMSYCNCWDYLLLHEDWGECSEDWAGHEGGGGGGKVEFWTEKKFLRGGGGVFGAPHAPTRGSHAGSENDTLLPMTCDRLKFWLGGQKLSSGNLGGRRIQKKIEKKILTKP